MTKILEYLQHPFGKTTNYLSIKDFAKQMFQSGLQSAKKLKKERNFNPFHILPTVWLIFLIVLGVVLPPKEITFFKSIFFTTNPWFEKVLEMYIFTLSLWSLILLSKNFTLKLWLQTISALVVQHFSWAIGYLKGLLT